MLITFKSKNAGDVMMYAEHAKPILDLLHKDIKRGVITVAESGAAIAKLETEIAQRRAHPVSQAVQHDVEVHQGDFGVGHETVQPVSFATRVYPLLELLRGAQRDGHDVAWGI